MLVSKPRTTGVVAATAPAAPVATLVTSAEQWQPPDRRRVLQLVLATLWVVDGVLQLQALMFSRSFGREMIAPMAVGNPTPIAHSIHWVGFAIANNAGPSNGAFALIQLLLGLGLAWRRTVKPALAASIGWALLVWWFGEGLGGVLNGNANPITGAPGAVVVYALVALLLWPAGADRVSTRFTAAEAVGEAPAKLLWALLWGGLGVLALLGANRSPRLTS
ncbi:MAG: hypothetical protein ACRDV4_05235, partial [Acidimicrobiales bacterium]